MNKISRRNFIRASALSALGAAAAGALSGCSNNAASSAAASSVASSAAASEQPAAAASSSITWDDIFATSYSQANRRSNPDAKAPETPEEYIEQKGNGDIMGSMMVGMVDSLNIPEEQFMNNKPACWAMSPSWPTRSSTPRTAKFWSSVPVRPVLPPPCAALKRA